jgi:formylglycine-generating enzyme required for sulfatase activity
MPPAPPVLAKDETNSLGMAFVLVPAGKFTRGSPESEPDRQEEEGPPHEVTLTRPFYLGRHEVTVAAFRRFVEEAGYQTQAERDGAGGWGYDAREQKFVGRHPAYTWRNPGYDQTDAHPVINVSWYDAVAFCEWLSKKEGRRYELPTEAEWEYACRAGTTTRFSTGDDPASLQGVANLADAAFLGKFPAASYAVGWNDSEPFAAPVGRYKPNPWGIYDLHGNVWEWCADWFERYTARAVTDPTGGPPGEHKVLRGGAYSVDPKQCRCADRYRSSPAGRNNYYGFRVVLRP